MSVFAFIELSVAELPALNAALNACAAVLIVAGLNFIKRGWETAHKWALLAAFAVSIAFLVSYVSYHVQIGGGRKFPTYPPAGIRYAYYAMLLTHVLLAVTVPFLAGGTIYLGLADRRLGHRRLARWTWPIWLYVSVTGVLIYVLLYQVYPPAG